MRVHPQIEVSRIGKKPSKSPILAILRYQGRTSKTPLAIYQTVSERLFSEAPILRCVSLRVRIGAKRCFAPL
jgi:hypothetical protein